jgi:hypothetical protein
MLYAAVLEQEEDSLHVGSGWTLATDGTGKAEMVPLVEFPSSIADKNESATKLNCVTESSSFTTFPTRATQCCKENSHTGNRNTWPNNTVTGDHHFPSFQQRRQTETINFIQGATRDRDPAEPEFESSKRPRLGNTGQSSGHDPRARRMSMDRSRQADFDSLSVGPGCPWLESPFP